MKFRILAAILFLFTLAALPARADLHPDNTAARTSVVTVQSGILGEERTLYIRVPVGYEAGEGTYPVVYVLDGEWNFDFVAGYLDYFDDNHLFPPMIVVGIENVSRNRDYVPAPADGHPGTGQGDAFYRFMDEEWIPFMQANYRTSGERILVGHSFGGVATMNAFFHQPERFSGYMAMGTSAWIADGVLFDRAEELFASDAPMDTFVYMAVGQGDGGPTVPSSQDLAEVFAREAPHDLDWTFDITPRTDHFTNFVSGLHDAFRAFFPQWELEDEMGAVAREGGAGAIHDWFEEKRDTLGIRFHPTWFDMSVEAFAVQRDGHHEAALAIMEEMRRHHPTQIDVSFFQGRIQEAAGRLEAAEASYLRTLDMAREQDAHPNVFPIPRGERALARVREKMADGAGE